MGTRGPKPTERRDCEGRLLPQCLYFCYESQRAAGRTYRYPRWYHFAQEGGLKFTGSHYAKYEQALADLPAFCSAVQSYLKSGAKPSKTKRVWLNARAIKGRGER